MIERVSDIDYPDRNGVIRSCDLCGNVIARVYACAVHIEKVEADFRAQHKSQERDVCLGCEVLKSLCQNCNPSEGKGES